MGAEVIVLPAFFGVIFAVAYLYFSTRNKERLALIEKGADASIFIKGRRKPMPVWRVLILNISLLLMGIGAGIFIGATLHAALGVKEDIAFPGAIFLTAGVGLFLSVMLSKKILKLDGREEE